MKNLNLLFEAIGKNKSLKNLSLKNSRFNKEVRCVPLLVQALKSNISLQKLNLSNCLFEDCCGCSWLFAALAANISLKHVKLKNSEFGRESYDQAYVKDAFSRKIFPWNF